MQVLPWRTVPALKGGDAQARDGPCGRLVRIQQAQLLLEGELVQERCDALRCRQRNILPGSATCACTGGVAAVRQRSQHCPVCCVWGPALSWPQGLLVDSVHLLACVRMTGTSNKHQEPRPAAMRTLHIWCVPCAGSLGIQHLLGQPDLCTGGAALQGDPRQVDQHILPPRRCPITGQEKCLPAAAGGKRTSAAITTITARSGRFRRGIAKCRRSIGCLPRTMVQRT